MSILEVIKKRRSIRRFKTEAVPIDDIYKIIEAGIWSPSSGNTKPFKFLILDDKKIIDKFFSLILENVVRWKHEAAKKKGISLSELYENYKNYFEGIKNAPVFIFVFLDIEKGANSFTNGNIENLLTNSYLYNSLRDSLFLCVQNMLLEATELGLGSLYFELPRVSNVPVNKFLKLTHNLEFFLCIPIGYAAEEPEPEDREVETFLIKNYYNDS